MKKYILLWVALLFVTSCGIQSIPKSKNEVEAAWAEVLNQYKRRTDLIPNLVNVVKGYAKHEKETLTQVVEARAKATKTNINVDKLTPQTMRSFQAAQGGLTSALSKLMVVVEKYPNLKANQNFRDLQVQLEGTENRITVARKRYIDSIKNYNNLVTVPPSSWTNALFYHHEKKPQFTVENEEEVKKAPEVKF
jgi:LemA protein